VAKDHQEWRKTVVLEEKKKKKKKKKKKFVFIIFKNRSESKCHVAPCQRKQVMAYLKNITRLITLSQLLLLILKNYALFTHNIAECLCT
jgi:hypothetical protein